MPQTFNCNKDPLSAFRAAKRSISSGGVIVVPTDTVYGLAADAFQPEAVGRLLEIKGRTAAPPVLVGSIETFQAIVDVLPEPALALAKRFWPGPLTLVLRTRPGLLWGDTVAVRIPRHNFLLQLLDEIGPLAVSSANISGRRPALSVRSARGSLRDKPAVYIDGDRIDNPDRVPSSIVDLTDFCEDSAGRIFEGVSPKTAQPRLLRDGAVPWKSLEKAMQMKLVKQ